MGAPDPSRHVGRPARPLLIAVAGLVVTLLVGLGWLPAASAAVGVPGSFSGHAYGSSQPPTADKPQSKLWFHDGAWWASMVGQGTASVFVHELMPDHTWRNTGTLVDSRANSTGDALWSVQDDRVYVASRAPGSNLQVNALGYDPTSRSWSVSPGFPVTVNSGGPPSPPPSTRTRWAISG
ncbi:hypothetical protein [Blastococcus brunescens]|uniref:Uncharacterized protein n=1 Tax=Blastococcus brunescens TaxID=1564165 RepID=A0ABZ1B0K6_9ACTN|nr:hypothetical protein [Blastococcus sp. BMG 8361]WRL64347.1 hypothetical protein U6N30_00295 [Blastococcus sp. BMG 8361]